MYNTKDQFKQMKNISVIIGLTVLFFGCKQEQKTQDPELAAIIKRNTIIIKGSDTELQMVKDLSKSFAKENTDILFDLTGGGSGIGIEALINGETDIANSSREIKPIEMARAEKMVFIQFLLCFRLMP